MTKHETESPDNPMRRKNKKWFLLVFVLAAVIIFWIQQRPAKIGGWQSDLPQALAQAKQENRDVIVAFLSTPPTDTTRFMRDTVFNKPDNRKYINKHHYICVQINIASLEDSLAKQYNITRLPTLIYFTSDGKERNRHEGKIGQVPFRTDFLEFKPGN